MSFLSGWQKGRIGREGTIGGWDRVVTFEDVVEFALVSDGTAETAGSELGREADAAIEVVVTFGFVGVTEVEVDVEETVAGTATLAVVDEEVEVATEAVARGVVEAESVVLEV